MNKQKLIKDFLSNYFDKEKDFLFKFERIGLESVDLLMDRSQIVKKFISSEPKDRFGFFNEFEKIGVESVDLLMDLILTKDFDWQLHEDIGDILLNLGRKDIDNYIYRVVKYLNSTHDAKIVSARILEHIGSKKALPFLRAREETDRNYQTEDDFYAYEAIEYAIMELEWYGKD